MRTRSIKGGCPQRPGLLAKAISLGLGFVAVSAAQAQLTTTDSYVFSHPAATLSDLHTTDPATAGPTTGSLSGTTLIGQFDPNNGVLTGTTIRLESIYTQKISGNGASSTSTGANTTTGTGTSSDVFLSAPGASQTFSIASVNGSCSRTGTGRSCTFGPTSSSTAATTILAIPDASLDSYVGGGTVGVTDGSKLSATSNRGTFARSRATYVSDWDGALTVTYTYLLHSNASFEGGDDTDTWTLDFGTVAQGSADPTQSFSLFNVLGSGEAADVVGLDLDAIAGGSSPFTTDLATFTALAAGSSLSFDVTFDTASPGTFLTTYTLNFSDADVGASSSRFANGPLLLFVRGTVLPAPPVGIPEPTTLLLLGCGLIGLGLGRVRQRQRRGRS